MLQIGVVVLGVVNVERAEAFWTQALNYEVRSGGFGGWSTVLQSGDGSGTLLALQTSETPPEAHPRQHLDLHVASSLEQTAEVNRLLTLGATRVV